MQEMMMSGHQSLENTPFVKQSSLQKQKSMAIEEVSLVMCQEVIQEIDEENKSNKSSVESPGNRSPRSPRRGNISPGR